MDAEPLKMGEACRNLSLTRDVASDDKKVSSAGSSRTAPRRVDDGGVGHCPGSPGAPQLLGDHSRQGEQVAIPSFFRKDRYALQCVCLVGLALSYSGSQVTIFQNLGTLTSTAIASSALPPGQGLVSVIVDVLPIWVHALLVIVVLAFACYEATRCPRLADHSTPVTFFRTLLQMVGDVLLCPVRAALPGEIPRVRCQKTLENDQILKLCPSLEGFKQTVWLRNPMLSLGALMVSDLLFSNMNRKNVRRELLRTPDGGHVALDWWEPSTGSTSLQSPRKVLLVGSTFTGDALVTITREICSYFTEMGWRCVVFVKRGCGLTMPNTQPGPEATGGQPVRPWCLSNLEDVELAIDHVASRFPEAFLCGLGLSTGAGQLRNYVNRRGSGSKLAAAVLVDAASTWKEAIESVDSRLPIIASVLASAARISYQNVFHSQPPAKQADGEAVKSRPPAVAGGIVQFVQEHMAPAHGFGGGSEGAARYVESCDPVDASGCAVPVLELLTLNDALMSADLVERTAEAWKKSPRVIAATTTDGTHMVRWEGIFPQCWIRRVSGEFLEAVRLLTNEQGI